MAESASSPVCAVCLRHIALTQAGMGCMHGPFRARCPGSGRTPGSRPMKSGPAVTTTFTAESIVQYMPQTPLPSGSDTPVPVPVQPVRPSLKLIRLPKGSREFGGRKLASILESFVVANDHTSWIRLLSFGSRCLRAPRRAGKRSLASAVNKQLNEEVDAEMTVSAGIKSRRKGNSKYLASKVSSKLEEGDFKGAVRLPCSENSFTDFSDLTYTALTSKHQAPLADSAILPSVVPTSITTFMVSVDEIVQANRTFLRGSVGGPDGLRHLHLKDMIGPCSGAGDEALLPSLVAFVSLILNGECPE